MSEDLYLPLALTAVALVIVALVVSLVALRRSRIEAAEVLATSREEAAALREQVERLARDVDGRARPTPEEFVITGMGREGTEQPPAPASRIEGRTEGRIQGRLFADIVLRESALKAASLGAGVRRALAPETRNRIRFEMKREVKRARKQRRAELKDIRRERAARARRQEEVA